MPLRLGAGIVFALLFAAPMALHFVLTDRTFEEHERARFDSRGRYLLAAGLVAGRFLVGLVLYAALLGLTTAAEA